MRATVTCGCSRYCGDLDIEDDNSSAVCKGLPMAPSRPLVEIVMVPRSPAPVPSERER